MNDDTYDIHTCHENCQRIACVLRRELTDVTKQRDEARDERDKMHIKLDMWRDGNIMHEVHRNELEKVEQQRDALAEALRVATAYPLSESWYKQAIKALATLKQ
jgi:hypothetical protein